MAQPDLDSVISELLEWCNRHQWRGFDPYDGLRTCPFRPRSPKTRQAVVQAFKHSPFDLRKLTGAKPFEIAKASAIALSAACLLDEPELRTALRERLLGARGPDALWGYEFDVQTRWAFYPARSPNAVVTSFALHALVDDAGHPEAIADATEALLASFLRGSRSGPYVAYVLESDTLIHNANLLAGAAVVRAGRALGRPEWEEVGVDVARTSVAAQGSDGSWVYGERPNLGWVDGFHSAYNLIALAYIPHAEFVKPLEKGLQFYLANLFERDGRPRLRVDRRGLLEVHTAATALWCLATFVDRLDAVRPTLDGCLRHAMKLHRPDGSFAFTPLHGIPYLRWGQAHMLLGLAAVRKALR